MKLDEMRDNKWHKRNGLLKKEKDEKTKKQKQQQEQMLTIGVGFALILFAVFGFLKLGFRNIDCKRLSDHCRKYLPNPLSFISRIRILDCH